MVVRAAEPAADGAAVSDGVDAATGLDSRSTVEAQSPAGAWRSISHALQQVQPGSTIRVAPGTYAESAETAFPNVTLRATGAANAVIIAPPTGQAALVVDQPGIVVEGFVLLGGTHGIRATNANALRIATWLEAQPKVRRVWYPGLASHPDHAVALRCLRGAGGVVTFELDTDLDGAIRFTDACRVPYIAPSLGGVESLVEMPVIMSYWDIERAERMKLGISDSLIRLSCGIEDADDLLADLQQALAAV